MKLKDICSLVNGKILTGQSREEENVDFAFASDLMSDVLTLKIDNFILITGLANLQTIRTAEMSDIQYILFARDKKVTEDMIDLAEENNFVLIATEFSLFKCSGILYGNGLKPVY